MQTPFNVMLDYDATNGFVGNCEMYSFFYADRIIRLRNGNVTVEE